LRQGGGSVTVRLAPESLGQVRIRLDLDQGSVSARFDVGGPEARRLLEADMGALRSALEARGLSVDDLRVAIRPELAAAEERPRDAGAEAHNPGDQHAGGAGDRGGGDRADARDSRASSERQEAASARPDGESTVEPWWDTSGGAVFETPQPGLIRLRLDTVA
jgi:flagellar hook-length control protein FliK